MENVLVGTMNIPVLIEKYKEEARYWANKDERYGHDDGDRHDEGKADKDWGHGKHQEEDQRERGEGKEGEEDAEQAEHNEKACPDIEDVNTKLNNGKTPNIIGNILRSESWFCFGNSLLKQKNSKNLKASLSAGSVSTIMYL